MKKFAFIVHPLSSADFYESVLGLKGFSSYFWKNLLLKIPPFKVLHIKKIFSKIGEEIEGYVVMCPLTPDQLALNKQKFAKEKVFDACSVAKRFGVDIIGLGGHTSVVTDGGKDLVNLIGIPLTTGNTFTATLVIDSILKAVDLLKINLNKSVFTVIGASGDIGSTCTKEFVKYVNNINLVARDQGKLELLAHQIKKIREEVNIKIGSDSENFIDKSDVVILATSAYTKLVEVRNLKKGAVLCDVSYPANVDLQEILERNDVLVFEGGLAKTNCFEHIRGRSIKLINFFNSPGVIHGCFAETILLTFEGIFENFSLGRGQIGVDKISLMRDLALKHGFSIAPYICGAKVYSDLEIDFIKC